jgi:Ca-activated chloride channel family protein
MGGDSISQARIALNEILNLLRPQDLFNVIRFGNRCLKLFSFPVRSEHQNLIKARNLLEVIDADMGGTEIGQAVAAAVKTRVAKDFQNDVLLITDGEVYQWEAVTDMVKTSGMRFFTVGVGNSVAEAFVRELAEVTGGACELVSPNEDMADKIVRHFKRIYYPRAEKISLKWPEGAEMIPSKLTTAFDGDTLFAFARFRQRPEGNVTLTAQLENGETLTQVATPSRDSDFDNTPEIPGTLARMAAATEMKSLSNSRKVSETAIKYQLMSRYTNYLAIDVKADKEKAADLPVLRKVPQMLAAGWGGSGRVLKLVGMVMRQDTFGLPSMDTGRIYKLRQGAFTGGEQVRIVGEHFIIDFIKALNDLHSIYDSKSTLVETIIGLKDIGLPEDIVHALLALKKSGIDENIIVVVFLYVLTEQKRFNTVMSRELRRFITKAYKQLPKFDETIKADIEAVL